MADGLQPNRDGLQPSSDGLQLNSDGLQWPPNLLAMASNLIFSMSAFLSLACPKERNAFLAILQENAFVIWA